MFEKVNPMHPDKVADRIAGALVDLAYKKAKNPKIAAEVLIGHGKAFIIAETSEKFHETEVEKIVNRIANTYRVNYIEVPQDQHLAHNQDGKIRCGDNGIFKGMPTTYEQWLLTQIAQMLYAHYPTDGKYLIDNTELTICQSWAQSENIKELINQRYVKESLLFLQGMKVNPLGSWTGGPAVDCGATNRKLGSDMGDAVTGGGLHGKDLSKADVTLNIYCHIMAQKMHKPFELSCSIGDEIIDDKPYSEIVEIARDYINSIGGFEKFAEWGLIR